MIASALHSPPTPISDRTPSPHDMRRVGGQHVPGGCAGAARRRFSPHVRGSGRRQCVTHQMNASWRRWHGHGGAVSIRHHHRPRHGHAPGWRSTCTWGVCGSGPEAVFTPCAWQRPSAMCYTPKWPPLGGAGMGRGITPHCPSPPPTHDRAPGWRSTCEMGCAGAARIWHFFVVRIQI